MPLLLLEEQQEKSQASRWTLIIRHQVHLTAVAGIVRKDQDQDVVVVKCVGTLASNRIEVTGAMVFHMHHIISDAAVGVVEVDEAVVVVKGEEEPGGEDEEEVVVAVAGWCECVDHKGHTLTLGCFLYSSDVCCCCCNNNSSRQII